MGRNSNGNNRNLSDSGCNLYSRNQKYDKSNSTRLLRRGGGKIKTKLKYKKKSYEVYPEKNPARYKEVHLQNEKKASVIDIQKNKWVITSKNNIKAAGKTN